MWFTKTTKTQQKLVFLFSKLSYFLLMPFPTTTPVMPRTTGKLNVVVDVLEKTNAPPRPVQHLPEKNCLSPTRGALPAAGNHAPTMARPGSCWSSPPTCVEPRTTGKLNVAVDVLKKPSSPPRPVQHLPEKNCLSPTRGALPAGNNAPTMARPGSCWPYPATPVVRCTTNGMNVVVDVLEKTSALQRPVPHLHLPKENWAPCSNS